MRNFFLKRIVYALPLVTLAIGMSSPVGAANAFLWNVTTPGANAWNVAGNWNPNGVAGLADTNIFGTIGTSPNVTTINNVVTANDTISTLLYTNTATAGTAFHVTQIPAGVTLIVSSNLSVSAPGQLDAVATYAAMVDAGTLQVNGSALNVADSGLNNANALATLDLSGLSNFVYNASSGSINVAGGGVTRVGGVLLLAGASNNITAGTINFGTGNGAQAGNGSSAFKFGAGTNIVNVGTFNIVNNKNSGTVSFVTANGGLRMRGVTGADTDRATLVIGNRNQTGTGTTTGNLSLNNHPVDIKAGTVTIGTDLVSGGNAAVGTFTFNQGTVDATAVNLAASGNAAVTGSTGTMGVGTAGTLIANTISLVNETVLQTAGAALGNLYVTNGGTLICSNGIVKSTLLGVGNVHFSSATVSMIGGTIGTSVIPVDNLNITNSTLTVAVFVNNSPTNMVATTLNVGAGASTINISSLPPVVAYPTQFKLIAYTAINGTPSFTLGTLPGIFTGYISNNAGSIDLVITNGPTPPPTSKAVTWDGEVSTAWDTTTTNWSNAGNLTNYNNITSSGFGDAVTFDDSLLGTTNVNLTQLLSPGSLTVNNTLSNYVFTGSGKITGPIGLTKQGTGSLTLANAAANDFSGPITLTSGSLVYDQSVDATVAPAISGSGALVKNNINTLTLAANNTALLGGITINSGTLRAIGTNALGITTPTVVNNATLVSGPTNLNSITLSNATLGVANADFIMATNKELVIAANSTNILIATDPQSPTVSRNIEVDANLRGSGTIIIANATGVTSPDGSNGARFRNTNAVSDFTGTIIVTNNSKSELLLQGAGPYSPVGTGKFILYAGLYDGNNTLTAPAIGGYLEFNFRNGGGSTIVGNDFAIAGTGAVVINGLGSPNGAVVTAGNLKIGAGQELIGYRAAGAITNTAQFTTVTLTGGNAIFSPHSSAFGPATQAGTDFSLGAIGETTSGSGIIMGGRGNLTLTGVNGYTGNTSVTNGVLFLSGTASIASSPNIIVGAGARFDVSTLASTFALGAAQTLSNLTSTAIIAGPADASVGTVSLNYLSGTPSFTVVSSSLTVASGTTLKVNNTGAALAKGSYKIISGNVLGTAPSSVTVGGNGVANATTPTAQITANELYLVVPNAAPLVAHIVTNSNTAGVSWKIAISDLRTAAGWSDADNDTITFSGVNPTSNLGKSVTTDGTFVYYNAPVNAEDFITYTIGDGTSTANGTIYLETVPAPPAPASANQIVTGGNGVPTITFAGIPGRTNIVQASTNLTDWTSISTNVAGTNGLWQVTDPDATNFVNRFYRSFQPTP